MAKKNVKAITNQELKGIVDSELTASMGFMGSELADDRTKAMQRYLGEPLGTEMDGRSEVQTRDVMDVIEWIMPSLIRIFTDTDSAVKFEPVGPEDEQQAEQETDYINYLFYKKNPGFLILYTWFKDALLQKNGILKAYPEEDEDVSRETYEYLTDEEFNSLNADPANELIEHETETIQSDMGVDIKVHNATFLHTETKKSICIENVAPEDYGISTDIRSVFPRHARFQFERKYITVSELRENGYSQSEIDDMEDAPNVPLNTEQVARFNLTDEQNFDTDINSAMRTKMVYECYLRADKNGDGIAEMLKIFRSGDFIDVEEVDEAPFYAITPIILTHKFFGLSVADIIKDIQEIKTTLLRSFFDNIYQDINKTTYYDENTVNVEDLLSSTPWGIRAVNGSPMDKVMVVGSTGLPQSAFDLFQLMDGLKQQRIGDFQAQIDPAILANAQTGVVMRMTMEAKAKTEMIARIFAETGVKDLFRGLHELSRKYMDKETVVQLRGNWVPVNPADWRERTDMTVKVGMGNTTKEEKIGNALDIISLQERLAQQGVVTNAYSAGVDYLKAMGKVNPDKYIPNPATLPPKQPQPDPTLILGQMQMQIEQMKVQAQREKTAIEDQQTQRDQGIRIQELSIREQEMAAQAQIQAMRAQIQHISDQAKLADQASKNDLQERTAILKAEMDKLQMILTMSQAHDKNSQAMEMAELNAKTQIVTTQQRSMPTPETQALANQAANSLMSDLFDMVSEMKQELNAPKQVIRGPDGRIMQIGKQQVNRDENGRVTSVG